MTRPGWEKQTPRLESLDQAWVREQSEALERPCPVHRCRAPVGVLCLNPETGKPYRLNQSHWQRVHP